MTSKSTRKRRVGKPTEPCRDFALYAHAIGRRAKEIRGELRQEWPKGYPEGALERALHQEDELCAARTPGATSDGLTIGDPCNRRLPGKKPAVDSEGQGGKGEGREPLV